MKQIERVPYPNAWPSLKWDLTSDLILDAIIYRKHEAPSDTEIDDMYEAQRKGLVASAEEEQDND